MKNQEKPSNSIRKQTWFSWRTNGIQSFIGWFPFLLFSIGWTVFIPGPKKKENKRKQKKTIKEKRCFHASMALPTRYLFSSSLILSITHSSWKKYITNPCSFSERSRLKQKTSGNIFVFEFLFFLF
jgi:hypothetical protein